MTVKTTLSLPEPFASIPRYPLLFGPVSLPVVLLSIPALLLLLAFMSTELRQYPE